MAKTILTSVQFASVEAASKAKARLIRAGFARKSISLLRADGDYEVSIRTREDDISQVERLLDHSPRPIAKTIPGNTPAALVLAVLAGAALFHLTKRA